MELKIVHDALYGQLKKLVPLLDGFRWQADGGFLLATVRQHDFTEHDPDLDITMPRDDYEKWLKKVREEKLIEIVDPSNFAEEFKSQYGLLTDEHRFRFTKFINYGTLLLHKNWIDSKEYYLMGTTIDIFPVDNIPDSIIDRMQLLSELRKKRLEIGSIRKKEGESERYLKGVEEFDSIRQKYNGEKTKYCATLGLISRPHFDGRWLRFMDKYDDIVEMKFRDIMVKCPSDYHRVLSNQYGMDYMTPQGKIPENLIISDRLTYKDVYENPEYYKNQETPIVL